MLFTPFLRTLHTIGTQHSLHTHLFAEERFNVDPQLRGDILTLMERNLISFGPVFPKLIEPGFCRADIDPPSLAVITFVRFA
jgi:hypothetical protein